MSVGRIMKNSKLPLLSFIVAESGSAWLMGSNTNIKPNISSVKYVPVRSHELNLN